MNNPNNHNSAILDRFRMFVSENKIPHILLCGESGSGKRTLVSSFVSMIYNDNASLIKSRVMYVNCNYGKGIRFIREDIKFFAKSQYNKSQYGNVKLIILYNADKLTTDAQSALRRCIEQFSNNTRFLMVVRDKFTILGPILSRFCEITVKRQIINNVPINLHKHYVEQKYRPLDPEFINSWLFNAIDNLYTLPENELDVELIKTAIDIFENGYSGLDVMSYIERIKINRLDNLQLLVFIQQIKSEFRNEKLFIMTILHFMFRSKVELKNIMSL